MSQMTLIQLVSQMQPEVGGAFIQLALELSGVDATPLTHVDSTLPCALVAMYPCGCSLEIRIAPALRSESAPDRTSAAPLSGSEPDSPSIHDGSADVLTTRWGIA